MTYASEPQLLQSSARLRVAGILLLTFAAGALSGGAVTRAYFGAPLDRAVTTHREAPIPESAAAGIPPQLVQLGLTTDQRARIKQVVTHRQPTADSITESVLPRVRALELTMRQEMMCALTPAQQQRWMQWRREQGLSLAEGEDWLALVRAGKCEQHAAGAR